MMLHTKYQGSRPFGFRQEDFKVFISKIYFRLCDLDTERTGTIRTLIRQGHIRIIPVKFCKNSASSLKDVL